MSELFREWQRHNLNPHWRRDVLGLLPVMAAAWAMLLAPVWWWPFGPKPDPKPKPIITQPRVPGGVPS